MTVKTWYPALDERNGTYQLLKAEMKAREKYSRELLRIQELRNLQERCRVSNLITQVKAPSLSHQSIATRSIIQPAGARPVTRGSEAGLSPQSLFYSEKSQRNGSQTPQAQMGMKSAQETSNPGKGNFNQQEGGPGGQYQGMDHPSQGQKNQAHGMNQQQGQYDKNQGTNNHQQGQHNNNQGMNNQQQNRNTHSQGMSNQQKGHGNQNQDIQNQQQGGKKQNQGMKNQQQGQKNQNQNQNMNNQQQGQCNQNQGTNNQQQGQRNQNQGMNSQHENQRNFCESQRNKKKMSIGEAQGNVNRFDCGPNNERRNSTFDSSSRCGHSHFDDPKLLYRSFPKPNDNTCTCPRRASVMTSQDAYPEIFGEFANSREISLGLGTPSHRDPRSRRSSVAFSDFPHYKNESRSLEEYGDTHMSRSPSYYTA